MKSTIWKNCYSDSWKGILIDQAFQHPAKVSLALAKKIFQHAIAEGWISKGDTCLDPFAGIGGVAFGAMAAGLKFVGQELELHFVELANGMECTQEKLCPTCKARAEQPISKNGSLFDELTGNHHFEGNLEFWRRKFGLSGAVILQGDSRQLLQNLQGLVECVVSSPPYEHDSTFRINKLENGHINAPRFYGKTAGQLGNLPAGNVDVVISSPPYIESDVSQTHMTSNKRGDVANKNYRPSWKKKLADGYDKTFRPYGSSSGQLAAMLEGSFDLVASSPPYEDNGSNLGAVGNTNSMRQQIYNSSKRNAAYGKTENQLGNSTGVTFWSAAREIVQQCFLALRPGGHAIWITKRFVRDGQIVEFSEQWAKLCESMGFKLVCWHHALLVDEGAPQVNIDGQDEIKKIERKSFFRRLVEKKGSPRIDWEDVICMVKPKNALYRP